MVANCLKLKILLEFTFSLYNTGKTKVAHAWPRQRLLRFKYASAWVTEKELSFCRCWHVFMAVTRLLPNILLLLHILLVFCWKRLLGSIVPNLFTLLQFSSHGVWLLACYIIAALVGRMGSPYPQRNQKKYIVVPLQWVGLWNFTSCASHLLYVVIKSNIIGSGAPLWIGITWTSCIVGY